MGRGCRRGRAGHPRSPLPHSAHAVLPNPAAPPLPEGPWCSLQTPQPRPGDTLKDQESPPPGGVSVPFAALSPVRSAVEQRRKQERTPGGEDTGGGDAGGGDAGGGGAGGGGMGEGMLGEGTQGEGVQGEGMRGTGPREPHP